MRKAERMGSTIEELVGKEFAMDWPVADGDTAQHWGSGALPVLASPRLVAFMEATCCHLLHDALPQGQTTVGVEFTLHHLRPTLPGVTIQVCATLTAAQGRTLEFTLEASYRGEQLARASHSRVVVDAQRFMGKLANPPETQHH